MTSNGFLDEWYQSGFEIFKRNVLAYYHNIQRCIVNDLLIFGEDERNQKLINKMVILITMFVTLLLKLAVILLIINQPKTKMVNMLLI